MSLNAVDIDYMLLHAVYTEYYMLGVDACNGYKLCVCME